MQHIRLNPVRDAVFSAINSDARAEALHQFFRHGAHIFVLAGAVRDAIAAHYEGEGKGDSRDLDIAVANVGRELFDDVLGGVGKKNRHGGYVLNRPDALNWDIWRLEETIGLKKTGAQCSIENVLRSFNLDCNAIALDVSTGLFLDAGAIEAIRKKRLGFVENVIRHSTDTFAAKALLLNLRSGLQLTSEMERFVSRHLRTGSLQYETAKVFPGAVYLRSLSPES